MESSGVGNMEVLLVDKDILSGNGQSPIVLGAKWGGGKWCVNLSWLLACNGLHPHRLDGRNEPDAKIVVAGAGHWQAVRYSAKVKRPEVFIVAVGDGALKC